ncbi:unnamed protein product, partial [Dibothriocephalus latus]
MSSYKKIPHSSPEPPNFMEQSEVKEEGMPTEYCFPIPPRELEIPRVVVTTPDSLHVTDRSGDTGQQENPFSWCQ